MTKQQLMERLGTEAAIARLFDIERQAVHQWPTDETIPLLRLLQLKDMKPHWFRKRK